MSESRFMRWAGVIGDLGSPFYREERQRDVWNEASAVGFQAMIWLMFLVATASLWIGGRQALPYAIAILFAIGFSSMITLGYAARQGVQAASRRWVSVPRLVVIGVIYVAMIGGMLRALWSDFAETSIRVGLVTGLAVTFVLIVVLALRTRRAAASDEDAEADDERV